MSYQPRTYRNRIQSPGLVAFRVVVQETDLHIQARMALEDLARERVLHHRGVIEAYIARNPLFATSLVPWSETGPTPELVREMAAAGQAAGVGPMAAVAGGMAAAVGRDLLERSDEVIIENGGDVFLCTEGPATIGIDAGDAAVGGRFGLRTGGGGAPLGICTSSGTVGHSHSFGRADAVCVVSSSCALADAAATAICNRIQGTDDIRRAIEWGRTIRNIRGIVIIHEGKIGAWGEVELVPLGGKKG